MLHENVKKFMEGFRYAPVGIFLKHGRCAVDVVLSRFEAHPGPASWLRYAPIARLRQFLPPPVIHIVGRPYIYPDNDLPAAAASTVHQRQPRSTVQNGVIPDGANCSVTPTATNCRPQRYCISSVRPYASFFGAAAAYLRSAAQRRRTKRCCALETAPSTASPEKAPSRGAVWQKLTALMNFGHPSPAVMPKIKRLPTSCFRHRQNRASKSR